MLHRLCDGLTAAIRLWAWIVFAVLIAAVALQVIARNLLDVPMIWTSDLAQLLFTWLIFVGSALGLRSGVHYVVDVLPTDRPAVALAVEIISLLASVVVVWILIQHGWTLAQMRASGEIQSLGLSRFWAYLPLPVSGVLMAIFLLEQAVALIGRLKGIRP